MGDTTEMRPECIRLHEKHNQRIHALEEYQKIQNGNLGRMAKALESFQNRLTWILILLVAFASLAIPEMVLKIIGLLK